MTNLDNFELVGRVRSLMEVAELSKSSYASAPYVQPPYNWIDQRFESPGRGMELALINDAVVIDVFNVFHKPSSSFITELSYPNSLSTFRVPHSYDAERKVLTVRREKARIRKKIDGICFLVGGHSNHYHWILNWLPRFEVLYKLQRSLSLSPAKFCVHYGISEAHLQSLSLIGVKREDIVVLRPDVYEYEFESLLVPSFFSSHCYYVEVIDFLRRVPFRPDLAPGNGIYISRNSINVPRRRILNEPDLLGLFEKYNIRRCVLEDMEFADQVSAFHTTKQVIAAHGAGLANLAFCDSGTRCILFEGKKVSEFAELAKFCGLDCIIVDPSVHVDLDAEARIPHFHPRNRDIFVDAEELERLIHV